MGLGGFLGNAAFLVFESTDFSNKYIRPVFNLSPKPHGIITVECKFFMTNFFIKHCGMQKLHPVRFEKNEVLKDFRCMIFRIHDDPDHDELYYIG